MAGFLSGWWSRQKRAGSKAKGSHSESSPKVGGKYKGGASRYRRFPLCLEQLEDRLAPSVLTFVAPTGNGQNSMSLFLKGSNLRLLDNGKLVGSQPAANVTAVQITGGNNEPNSLTINFSAGGFFSIPGLITFNGGTGGSNSLAVIGNGLIGGAYLPSGIAAGSGTLTAGTDTINFSNLQPLTLSNLTNFTLTTPNSTNVITIDSPAANQNRISGSSGGVTFESATFFNIPTVTIDTATHDVAGSSGDTVVVNTGGVAASGLKYFTINTGINNDAVTINEPFVLPVSGGSFTVSEDGGNNSLTINGTTSSDTIAMTRNTVTVDGNTVTFSGVENLTVNTLVGGATVTMTSIDPTVVTTVAAAIGTSPNSFSANLVGNFSGILQVLHFGPITFLLNKDGLGNANFSGSLNVSGSGTIGTISVGGTITSTGTVSTETIQTLNVTGDVSGTVSAKGSGSIGTMTVGGSISSTGMVSTETIQSISVSGDVSGTVSAKGSGSIGTMTVGGSISSTGMVSTETIQTISVSGNVSGTVAAKGSGSIGSISIGGTITTTGTVSTETLQTITIKGDVSGTVTAQGSGSIGTMTVNGSISSTGTVSTQSLTTLNVHGTVSGTVSSSGSGTIVSASLAALAPSGLISAEDIGTITFSGDLAGTVSATVGANQHGTGSIQSIVVGGNLTGLIVASGLLSSVSVTGSTPGRIIAGAVGTVSALHGIGSPFLQITQAGVFRQVQAIQASTGGPAPASVVFQYFYDSTGPGNPQLSLRVTNGDPTTSADDVRFDLSLVTNIGAEFDLARIDSVGTADIRSLSVDGNLLPSVTPAALNFFGLPSGTPGGVRLTDPLGGFAARDNVVAGTVQAASVEAVAFGSLTTSGGTVLAQNATHVDAGNLLAPGTLIVQANDTFRVPFFETQPVAFFLDTGPSGFDGRDVLFTDQTVNNASLNAIIGASASGGTSTIQTIDLRGDGGSIQTQEPVISGITSTGPLGDLLLGSSNGVPNVTAPSIFGNIITSGPIFGTIQTTGQRIDPITGAITLVAADLGRTITDSNGNITGVTVVSSNGGIPGRIISRGNLDSQIFSQKDFTGVIAAQGDIGAIQRNPDGTAFVNSSGQLVRFGGFQSGGQFAGQLVTLGNIFGDVIAKSGLRGRVAAKGQTVAGLDPARFGILGNFDVSGNIEATGVIVCGGVIGDAAGGTFLAVSTVKGIIACKGNLNAMLGNTSAGFIFANVGAVPGNPNAAAIDAIFTNNGLPLAFDITDLDLAGLTLILNDLTALHVGPDGNLTGPIP